MIAGLSDEEFRIIIGVIFGVIFLVLIIKLLIIVLPEVFRIGEKVVDKGLDLGERAAPKVWKLIEDTVSPEKEPVKQEVHHHYAPQNVQTNTTTQNIKDSVIIDRSQGERPPGSTRNVTDSVVIDRNRVGSSSAPTPAPAPVPHSSVPRPVRPRCPNCGEDVKADWSVCPRCTVPLS
jgi:hypothetical protein